MVLLVIGAIIVKSKDESATPLYNSGDAYLLAGAILAFILLRYITKRRAGK